MISAKGTPFPALESLKKRWWFTTFLTLLALGTGYLTMIWSMGSKFAIQWVILPTVTSVFILFVLWQNLGQNFRKDENILLPDLGWGNLMTLARGIFVALMMGFLFIPKLTGYLMWVPGVLYILANLTDFLDGYLARITDHTTKLGEKLDMSFDGLGVMAASLLAIKYGQLPSWYISVAFARYLFIVGLWLRRSYGKPVYDLPPSIWRRVAAGLQMGFLAVILLPLFTPPGTHIAAYLFGIPFLVGFFGDWLSVCGIRIALPGNQPTRIKNWLFLFIRALITILSIAIFIGFFNLQSSQSSVMWLVAINLAILSILILLGIAPRVAGILGLINLGIYQMFLNLTSTEISLAIGYSMIIFFGSGQYSLWLPENNIIYRRPGDKNTPSRERAP